MLISLNFSINNAQTSKMRKRKYKNMLAKRMSLINSKRTERNRNSMKSNKSDKDLLKDKLRYYAI